VAISREEIRHVAMLARLELADEELERFTGQLGAILEYVDKLREIETEKVEPRISAAAVGNVFREDEPAESLPREDVIAEAPSTDGEHFLVPPIIEPGGGA